MITITMYYWGGEKFGFKIKNACKECDINFSIFEDMKQGEFKGQKVIINVKPWLTNLWAALSCGGWHAPVVVVNGKLFSQGIVVDRKKFAEVALAEKLN